MEQNKKQREYERKNVTADSYGNVILIKPIIGEKLSSDFIFPITRLKDYSDQLISSKSPIPTRKSPDPMENKSPDLKNSPNKNRTKDRFKKASKGEKAEFNFDPTKFTYLKDNKQIFQPVGSNFEYFVPEVGVSLTENTKNKNGGKDFTSFFGKPSKYDYLNLTKENLKKSQNLLSASSYIVSLTEPNDSRNDKRNIKNTVLGTSAQLTLPVITDKNMKSSFQSNASSFNPAVETLKVSTKLTGSLKHALDVLDLIPEYKESENSNNNIDLFKNRRNFNQEKKNFDKKLISSSLDEINKFNFEIMKNKGWGLYGSEKTDKPKLEGPKPRFKPSKKALEKELGMNIVNTKLPRSRVLASLLNKIS